MKHFVVVITYKAPSEKITELRPIHREHLQKGYESGLLLMSGPQNPQIGGIAIARAESKEDVAEFFAEDTYNLEDAAVYNITEFTPVSRQDFMNNWIDGE